MEDWRKFVFSFWVKSFVLKIFGSYFRASISKLFFSVNPLADSWIVVFIFYVQSGRKGEGKGNKSIQHWCARVLNILPNLLQSFPWMKPQLKERKPQATLTFWYLDFFFIALASLFFSFMMVFFFYNFIWWIFFTYLFLLLDN